MHTSSSTFARWIAALPLALAAGCGAAPASDEPHAIDVKIAALDPSVDMGYEDLPRGYFNVNADNYEDYCRVVGDSPNLFISCKLGSIEGFTGDEYQYNSVEGVDLGYSNLPRGFIDVNGDLRDDYCRFVGDSPSIFLSCDLADSLGFELNQYGFNSMDGIDLGYSSMTREFFDGTGDGRADFCRFVGDRDNADYCCLPAGNGSFGPDQYFCPGQEQPEPPAPPSTPKPPSTPNPPSEPKPDPCAGFQSSACSASIAACSTSQADGMTECKNGKLACKAVPCRGSEPSCYCASSGGVCGGALYDSCSAGAPCGPNLSCDWNADQQRYYCVATCPDRFPTGTCWKPADAGTCSSKTTFPE